MMRSFILSLLLSLVFCAAGGQAAECLDPSPALKAGEDPFAPINVRKLTPAEHEAIKGLLTTLEGKWQGRAVDIYCRDIKDPQDRDINYYTARAAADVDYYGNFSIRVDLYSKHKKTSHQKVLRLYLAQQKLRVNSSSAYGDVELLTASSNAIAFFYRLLLTNTETKGSHRKEFFVSLDWDGHQLSIEQRIYSQGRLSHRQYWQLAQR